MRTMSSGKPTKEGELRKYKNLLQGWGSRYFKLERSYLHYFETKHAATPIDTMNRGDISQVIPSKQFSNKTYSFEVHTKSGTAWYMQADSEEEMMSWMSALMPDLYSSPSQSPQVPQRSPLYPSLTAYGLRVPASGSPGNPPSTQVSPYNHAHGYQTPPNSQYGTYTPPGVMQPMHSPYTTPPPGSQSYNPTPPGAHFVHLSHENYPTPVCPGAQYHTPPAASNNNTEYSPPPPYAEVADAPPLPTKGGMA